MYRKNTAGQFIHFQGVDSSTGGIKSGVTWTIRRCIDGTFGAGGGTVTEDGTAGWYKYAMAQADTNGNNIGFNFTGTGAVPQSVNILTDGSPPDVNLKNAAGTAVTLDANSVLNVSAKYVGGTLQTARDIGASVLLAAGQKVDVDTIKTNPVVNAGTVTFPTGATLASTTNITAAAGIDVAKINGISTTAVTALNANLGTSQPINFELTGASALVQGSLWQIKGQSISIVPAPGAVSIPTNIASTTNITAASGVVLSGAGVAAVATGVWGDTTAGDFTVGLSIGKSVMNGVALGTGLTVSSLTNLPAIPANWLTAAGIAANALNGKGDWLLSASYTAPPSATANAAAVWGTAMAELAAVPGPTAQIIDGLTFLFMGMRNRRETTATSDKVENNAGGVIGTAVLSDDGTTFTKGKFA